MTIYHEKCLQYALYINTRNSYSDYCTECLLSISIRGNCSKNTFKII